MSQSSQVPAIVPERAAVGPPVDGTVAALKSAGTWLFLSVTVLLTSLLSMGLSRQVGRIAFWWIANAVVLAVIVRLPRRDWFGPISAHMAGMLGANALASSLSAVGVALCVCDALEVVLAGLAIRVWDRKREFDLMQAETLFGFMGAAGVMAPAISGALTGAILHFVRGTGFWGVALQWFSANALGLLVVVPLLRATTLEGLTDGLRREHRGQAIVVLLVAPVVSGLLFWRGADHWLFLLLPISMVPAFYLNFAWSAVSVASLLLGGLAGILIEPSSTASVVREHADMLQVLVFVDFVMLLPVTSLVGRVRASERQLRANERQLRDVLAELEERVRVEVGRAMASERALIHQSRLAAMGEMVGHIAHQWRQPLNALSLVVANLRDHWRAGEVDNDGLEEDARLASKLIRQMSTTISDFSDFFRPDKTPTAFSVRTQVEEAIGLLSASFEHHHIEVVVLGDEDASIEGFANEYSQVVLNLLANARDAVLEAGSEVPRITISIRATEDRCTVCVADNGGGVRLEPLDRVFEPYVTSKRGGVGLGLYMSRMILERSMASTISVTNGELGAEFTIVSPRTRE